jgi:taurine dioxygenase
MSAVLNNVVVTPLGAALGADIQGIDLNIPINQYTRTQIIDAWHDHLVLRFRGQELSDESFVKFGRCFGELDLPYSSIAGKPRRPGLPEMTVISNIVENGKPLGGLGNFEAAWHTDMSFREAPPTASLLYAIEIPPSGGDTWFSNMYKAYDALPDRLKKRVEGRTCKHDHTYNSSGRLREGMTENQDPRTSPGAIHPIVRTHPVTGKKALYLGRRLNGYIPGMEPSESDALLDELWAHLSRKEFTWTQKWKVGDLIIWDNQCTAHYRESFNNNTRRLLRRLQVKGTKPF